MASSAVSPVAAANSASHPSMWSNNAARPPSTDGPAIVVVMLAGRGGKCRVEPEGLGQERVDAGGEVRHGLSLGSQGRKAQAGRPAPPAPATVGGCRHRLRSNRSSLRASASVSNRSAPSTWPTSCSWRSTRHSGAGRSWAPRTRRLPALVRYCARQPGGRHGTAFRHDRSRQRACDREQPVPVDGPRAPPTRDRLDMGRHAYQRTGANREESSCS